MHVTSYNYNGSTVQLSLIWWLMAIVLCLERKWLREFGFNTVLHDDWLTDEVAGHSSGYIWLSPQLQACYTGGNADTFITVPVSVM